MWCRWGCRGKTGKPKWHAKEADCPFRTEAVRIRNEARGKAPTPAPAPASTTPASGTTGGPSAAPTSGSTAPSAPATAAPTPGAAPAVPSKPAPEKKSPFQWPFKKAKVRTEAENPDHAPDHPPEDTSWLLDQKYVVRLVQTAIKFLKEGVGFIAEVVNVPPPEDRLFVIDPAEKDEMGDLLQEPATQFVRALGYKTKARAEMFVNGLAGLAFFGVMFMGLGKWGASTFRTVRERIRKGQTFDGRQLTPEELAQRKTRSFQLFRRKPKEAPAGLPAPELSRPRPEGATA